MLTWSFALAFYATPRMTRDLDIVIAVDAGAESLFNLMHYATGMKVDLIVRESTRYRIHEFARRREARLGDARTWVVSPEDLVLSKLVWARDSGSELQLRDV